jgi:hypothetical protein
MRGERSLYVTLPEPSLEATAAAYLRVAAERGQNAVALASQRRAGSRWLGSSSFPRDGLVFHEVRFLTGASRNGALGVATRHFGTTRRGIGDLFRANQIGEQPVRSRNPRWQLPKPRIRGKNINSLSIPRPQFTAFHRLISRIVR